MDLDDHNDPDVRRIGINVTIAAVIGQSISFLLAASLLREIRFVVAAIMAPVFLIVSAIAFAYWLEWSDPEEEPLRSWAGAPMPLRMWRQCLKGWARVLVNPFQWPVAVRCWRGRRSSETTRRVDAAFLKDLDACYRPALHCSCGMLWELEEPLSSMEKDTRFARSVGWFQVADGWLCPSCHEAKQREALEQ